MNTAVVMPSAIIVSPSTRPWSTSEGEVRKAISVVKKRTGGHEAAIRELAVGPRSIRVGAPLKDFHGIMTGVPRYVGGAGPLMDQREP